MIYCMFWFDAFFPLLINLLMFNLNIITGTSGDVCRTQMQNTEENIYFGRYFCFIVNLNSNNKLYINQQPQLD